MNKDQESQNERFIKIIRTLDLAGYVVLAVKPEELEGDKVSLNTVVVIREKE